MELNPQQRRAVELVDKPVLVLAGAGSGKTSVITQKIAWLIEHGGYAPRNIAAVTFTNKAAKEMKQRVASLLQGVNSSGLMVSTFHRLGLQILRSEHSLTYLRAGFSIVDNEDSMRLLKAIMSRDDADVENDALKAVQSTIGNWKNKSLSPQQVVDIADKPEVQRHALVYRQYSEALMAYNSVDFDDLILMPLNLLLQNERALHRWQNRIRYLLVDEFQDTNHSQYQLLQLLTQHHQALTAVGDDDQSIYAWRGAQSGNLLQLERDYPQLQLIKLEQNYRSTNRILQAANQLIANNPRHIEKRLWSKLGQGDQLRVVKRNNDFDEAQWILSDLQYRMIAHHRQLADFAILYRNNHQARALEVQLQAMAIPYKVSGATPFYARTEVKDILSYLRLLHNPDDDSALLRVINTPKRQIGSQTVMALCNDASARHTSIYSILGNNLSELLKPAQIAKLSAFKRLIDETTERCHRQPPIKVIQSLLESINYLQWLQDTSSSLKVAERRYSNVQILLDSLQYMMQRAERDQKCDMGAQPLTAMQLFEQAVKDLMIQDIVDNQNDEADSNRVQLLTLHACKGLEFKEIYLMAVEENLLPHYNNLEGVSLEEERRLFYVGITRARENLCITLAKQRSQYGALRPTTASRFLAELPADIDYFGFADKQKVDSQQDEDAAFNDIKLIVNGEL